MNARIAIAGFACVLAACGMDSAADDDSCTTSLSVNPFDPIAGQQVTVTAFATSTFGGVADYQWRVRFDQGDIDFVENGSGSEITFDTTDDNGDPRPGAYTVDMSASLPGSYCPDRQEMINVLPANGDELDVRIHVTPPPDLLVPPIDRFVLAPASTTSYALGTVVLDPGRQTSGTVGRAAYMRFMPDGQDEAIVEAYADATGAFSARVQNAPHHILVIPNDPAYPPQVIVDTPMAAESYVLDTGVAITGVVRRPNGTALSGAKVQLMIDEVPSTIATTIADGTFTLRASETTGTKSRVIVTPPATSGLPRLEAESGTFNFASGITVAYDNALITRNAGGTTVQRSGTLANTKVTIAGTIPAAMAGSVTAGASVNAIGYVRITATTDGSGVLPSTVVPAADLFAVVSPASGDYAVVAFDTSTSVPSTITAPAMIPFSTTIMHGTTSVGGARLELVPTGALGLAGATPSVFYASTNGTITGTLASGALYTARYSDPSQSAGPMNVPSVGVANLSAATVLPDPLIITGTLQIQGSPNRISGAAVEVLCNVGGDLPCTGLERDRAIGEDASDVQGSFTVAVTARNPM